MTPVLMEEILSVTMTKITSLMHSSMFRTDRLDRTVGPVLE